MAAKNTVTIKLVALGECSALTGRMVLRQGATLDVDKKTAAAAVADGRWAYASADDAKGTDEGGEA